MKNIKLVFWLLIMVISSNHLEAQDRNVVWVHGWGEAQDIWAFYDELFSTERQMNGSRTNTDINYIDNSGIPFAANNARNLINNSANTGIFQTNAIVGADPTRNMGIGHSLGGVVLRQIDRNENGSTPANKTINGIITVGSPNYGAGMADAVANGNLQSVLTDGCSRLAAGPYSSPAAPIAVILGWNRENLCDFFWDELNGIIPNAGSPTLQDLRLTGDFMSNQNTGLNQFQSSLPRISIWGNENSPTHWRLLSSYVTMDALGVANSDVLIPAVAHQFRGFYNHHFIMNTSFAIASAGLGFLNPWAFVAVPYFAYRAVQWKKGRDWFDNSESIWNALIVCQGSYTLTFTETTYLADNCDHLMTGTAPWINCIQQWCNGDLLNCTQTTTVNQIVNVNHPSDGLVCSYSQILNDIPQNNIYMAEGANHRDETDTRTGQNPSSTDVMQDIFNEIWDRQLGDFFRTD